MGENRGDARKRLGQVAREDLAGRLDQQDEEDRRPVGWIEPDGTAQDEVAEAARRHARAAKGVSNHKAADDEEDLDAERPLCEGGIDGGGDDGGGNAADALGIVEMVDHHAQDRDAAQPINEGQTRVPGDRGSFQCCPVARPHAHAPTTAPRSGALASRN